jgi:Resolvase, N terminal domain
VVLPVLTRVLACRASAAAQSPLAISFNGGNGLAGAQISCKIRALKSPAGRLVGYARVSTAQQDLTRHVRALKAECCAEIFAGTASGK